MESRKLTGNVLDIELKSLRDKYVRGIWHRESVQGENLIPYQLKLSAKISEYCRLNNIDFDESVNVFVSYHEHEGDYYFHFLAFSLVFYEIKNIESYLTYHLGTYSKKPEFITHLKKQIIPLVKEYSPFDNNERIKKILQWVKSRLGHIISSFCVGYCKCS